MLVPLRDAIADGFVEVDLDLTGVGHDHEDPTVFEDDHFFKEFLFFNSHWLDLPDYVEDREERHPVPDDDEQEDRRDDREEAAGVLRAHRVLNEREEHLYDSFHDVLEAGWDKTHLPRREDRDEEENGRRQPSREERIGNLEEADGPERLGFNLDVWLRGAEEKQAEAH